MEKSAAYDKHARLSKGEEIYPLSFQKSKRLNLFISEIAMHRNKLMYQVCYGNYQFITLIQRCKPLVFML